MTSPPKVFLLHYEIPVSRYCDRFDSAGNGLYDESVSRHIQELSDRINETCCDFAEIIEGPISQQEELVRKDFLVSVMDYGVLQLLDEVDDIVLTLPLGIIFVARESIYFVRPEVATPVNGEAARYLLKAMHLQRFRSIRDAFKEGLMTYLASQDICDDCLHDQIRWICKRPIDTMSMQEVRQLAGIDIAEDSDARQDGVFVITLFDNKQTLPLIANIGTKLERIPAAKCFRSFEETDGENHEIDFLYEGSKESLETVVIPGEFVSVRRLRGNEVFVTDRHPAILLNGDLVELRGDWITPLVQEKHLQIISDFELWVEQEAEAYVSDQVMEQLPSPVSDEVMTKINESINCIPRADDLMRIDGEELDMIARRIIRVVLPEGEG